MGALHHRVINISGKHFGRLTALEYAGGKKWFCVCECGNHVTVRSASLSKGTTVSCGCYQRQKTSERQRRHGMADGPEHRTWVNIKYRCNNPNASNYSRYGGAGIKVCDEWANSFEAFYAHMGPKPTRKHSIDRIDGSKGYEPGNCRWASALEQHRNKSSNHVLCFKDKSMTITEWAIETGINRAAIYQRLRKGWTVERALTEPPR